MTLDINGENLESIDKCLISEFLLPLGPLIIQDIFKGRNGVSLLPFSQCVDICEWRVEAVHLSLRAQDVLGIKSCLDPHAVDIVRIA